MLVDSHCHLDRLDLGAYPNGLDGAIEAAQERDVSAMLCVCISDENRQDVLDIAEKYPDIFASVGVHPADVSGDVVTVEQLCHWADHPRVVALGETGLDYYYAAEHAQTQQRSFQNHLCASAKLKLPTIVHTRDAREDTIALIERYGDPRVGGVLHCFTEDWQMAQKAINLNYYISISGIVTFKKADNVRDVVAKLPIDRLLVETDSPYLAPVPYRGKSNEPKYVREVAEFIAQFKGISFEQLCQQTTENFYRLFNRASY